MEIRNLKPNKKNPRTISDEKLIGLKMSIQKFGDLGCFVYNTRTKRLISGHQRQKSIPQDSEIVITHHYSEPTKARTIAEGYVVVDNEKFKYREVDADEVWETEAMLAANKHGGDWDQKLLDDLLKIPGVDLQVAGFEMPNVPSPDISDINNNENVKTEPEDEEIPEAIEPRSKLGDIWILGRHRLMCGDSFIDHSTLLKGKKIDLIFTDPPYGISIVKTGTDGAIAKTGFVSPRGSPSQLAKARQYKKIENDDKPFDPSFIFEIDAKSIILWGANHYASKLPDRPQWLVWDKKNQEGSLDDNNFSDVELAWTNSKKLSAKIYRHLWAGMVRAGNRDEELAVRVHPTQKPVGLCKQIISDFSANGDSVLDLFGGSGSTLIACEKTDRQCFMMELDPYYCDIIIARWEKFTGLVATRQEI